MKLEKSVIERLKELREKGKPYKRISRILKKEGYTTRTGGFYIAGSLNNLLLKDDPSFRTNHTKRTKRKVKAATATIKEVLKIPTPLLPTDMFPVPQITEPQVATLRFKNPDSESIDSAVIDNLDPLVKQALAAQARRSNTTIQLLIPKIVNNVVKEKILAEVENMVLL